MISLRRTAAGTLAAALISLGALAAAPASAASTASGPATPAGSRASSTSAMHRAALAPDTVGTFPNSVWTNFVNIRSGPGTGYAALGQAQIGQTLLDHCYTTGTNINGNPWWDHVTDTATGISGYVTEYYLIDGSQDLHC